MIIKEFGTMQFNTKGILTHFQQYLAKLASGLLLLGMLWQGVILGIDPAMASTLLATSADSISKQVTGKAEEMKGAATKSIGKAQSAMENQKGAIKMKIKDDLTETKIAVDKNAARAENAVDKAGTAVKDFFGK
jgi:uncharacterized protein YjbJ (UPF0337 family)